MRSSYVCDAQRHGGLIQDQSAPPTVRRGWPKTDYREGEQRTQTTGSGRDGGRKGCRRNGERGEVKVRNENGK